MWLAPAVLALACFWQGLPGGARQDAATAVGPSVAHAAAVPSAKSSVPTLKTRRIDGIRPGMRVLAEHPDAAENARPDIEIEPAAWRLVSLVVGKPDGGTLEIDSLWPAAELCGGYHKSQPSTAGSWPAFLDRVVSQSVVGTFFHDEMDSTNSLRKAGGACPT